jgi:hypothetical protein
MPKQSAAAHHQINPFPPCVGVADGTLFPLAFSPCTADAPDYSGRKFIPGLIPVSLTSIIVSVRPSHLGFKDKCQKGSMGA